jgi:protein SCO1/2
MKSPLLWGAFAAAALAVPGVAFYVQAARLENVPLPDLGAMPAFAFTDQRGEPFAAERLRGTPWIGNFIFTSCAEVCPMLTQQLRSLREQVKGAALAARFVSFSVDPERDTPEVLAAYARKHGADFPDWAFLTGDLAAVEKTVVNGFHVSMTKVAVDGDRAPAPGEAFDLVHGKKCVLVDGAGRIRGYYDADGEGFARLLRDLRALQPRS